MQKKIIINFTITILLLIILGIISIVKMNELANLSSKLYEHPFTVTNATKTIEANLISMHRYMKDVALSKNVHELQIAVDKVNSSEIIIYKQFNIIFERYLGDKQDIEVSYKAFIKWKPIRDKVIHLVKQHRNEEAAAITKNEGAKHVKNLNIQVYKLIDYAQKKATYFNKSAKESKFSAIFLISIILILILSITVSILIVLIKNLNKADRDTKEYFHLIDQNIMSVTLDINFKITEVSNAFARHIGFSIEELLKKPDGFLYSDCSKEQVDNIYKIAKSGQSWKGEINKIDNSGKKKWLLSDIHPIFDKNYIVIGYKNIFQDISSQKKIEKISNIDGLTNLYNRRYFDKIFQNQIKISKRNKSKLVFVMVDIDHFKQYNDTYGHQAGDTTLKKVSALLKGSLKRPDDYTFRLGGEEFGLLYSIDKDSLALKIADTIRKNIENLEIQHSGNSASKFVSVSMGVYIIKPDAQNDTEEIYKLTDELLYKAKNSGRNCAVAN